MVHNLTQLMRYGQPPCLQIQFEALGLWYPEALFSKMLWGPQAPLIARVMLS